MERNKRESINAKLRSFSPIYKDSDFIEVTEWVNGEGWDVSINEKIISLSRDELNAIHFLTIALDSNIEIQ